MGDLLLGGPGGVSVCSIAMDELNMFLGIPSNILCENKQFAQKLCGLAKFIPQLSCIPSYSSPNF